METTWWTQPEELDQAQREAVALNLHEDHLVIGPPGSGKTNLLILRAAFLYGAGLQNIVVLTFGRVLREFLVAGSRNYTLPPNKIQTYLRWGGTLLSSNEMKFRGQGDFKQLRRELLAHLQELARIGNQENVYDCVLIDEAQDYSPAEIDVIRAFTRRLFAVGDNQQRILEEQGALEALKASVASVKELPFHYRNGLKICRVADGIRNLVGSPRGLEQSSNYDESKYPSTVIDLGGLTITDQVESAIPEISTQLRAYPDGKIGVLCPLRDDVEHVWAELSGSSLADDIQLQQFSEGYTPFNLDRRVVVATTHGAKGLEFRALHLLGMDKINVFPLQRNLAYTAVTRAKTSLTIYHEDDLPGYFERGLVASQGRVVEPPKLTDLFRKG